jgi:hypothetical protein
VLVSELRTFCGHCSHAFVFNLAFLENLVLGIYNLDALEQIQPLGESLKVISCGLRINSGDIDDSAVQ